MGSYRYINIMFRYIALLVITPLLFAGTTVKRGPGSSVISNEGITLPQMESGEAVHFRADNENETGWQIVWLNGDEDSFLGSSRDSVFNILYGYNDTGTNLDSPFEPGFGDSFESKFLASVTNTINSPKSEYHRVITRVENEATLSSATGFSADTWFVVRDPTSANVVAWGWIEDLSGTTADLIWYETRKVNTDPPAVGDVIESTLTTTVTSRSGTFSEANGIIAVYASGTCGTTKDDIVGRLTLTAAPSGGGDDLEFIQYQGSSDDLVSGRCIRQVVQGAYSSGTTALLGTVTDGTNATISSLGTSTTTTVRSITSTYVYRDLSSSYVFNTTEEQFTNPGAGTRSSLRIGCEGGTDAWVGISSSWCGGLTDLVGVVGDPTTLKDFGFHRYASFFNGSNSGHRVQVDASSRTASAYTQYLGDFNGSIAGVTQDVDSGISHYGNTGDTDRDSGDEVCGEVDMVCVTSLDPTDGSEHSCSSAHPGTDDSASGYFIALCHADTP